MGTNHVNIKKNDFEEKDISQISFFCDKEAEFNVQFFGQNKILNIYIDKKLSLKELNLMIAKLFNFNKIESDRILLFYKESNRLNYTRIDSNNLQNIINKKNNIIIKAKISPEFEPKSKEVNELSKNL